MGDFFDNTRTEASTMYSSELNESEKLSKF